MIGIVGGIVVLGVLGFFVLSGGQGAEEETTDTMSTTGNEEADAMEMETGDGMAMIEDETELVEAEKLVSSVLAAYDEQAVSEAAEDGQAVLFFHATWCPTCKSATEDLQARSDEIPADVTIFRADFDTEDELKRKYNIVMQDTFVQVDPDLNEITQWNSGGEGVDALLARIQ